MRNYFVLFACLLCTCAPAPAGAWLPPTLEERAIVEHAVRYSPGAFDRDPFVLLDVLRLEELPGIEVPREFRGMSLAISFREARWADSALGDGGRALGWGQLHRANWGACGYFDRRSPEGSMRCWLWRVRVTYERKAYPRCRRGERLAALREGRAYDPKRVERGAWVAAWRWVARGGAFPGCDPGKPRLHWAQLRCWQMGERHSGVCRGYRGGWRGRLERYRRALL